MMFTIAMAIGIITTEPQVLREPWLHVKLLFVVLLLGYHFFCKRVMCKRVMRQLEAGTNSISRLQMRRINEIPTVLLGLIVLLAIFKSSLPTTTTAVGTGLSILAFAIIIQLYARKHRLQQEEVSTSS